MNKALLLIYDGFADFEVNLLSFFLKSKNYEVETFTIDSETITGESGFLFKPHKFISEIDNVESYELLAIPGGPIVDVIGDTALLNLCREFHAKEKWIVAICAGTALLAQAGVMKNVKFSSSLGPDVKEFQHIHDWQFKTDGDVTVHGKFITAIGSAYVEFASKVIKELNLYDPGEEKETLAYFKNQL